MGAVNSEPVMRIHNPAEQQLSHSQMRTLLHAGLSPDLALLPYQMPRMTSEAVLPTPKAREIATVNNPVNVRKDTVEAKEVDRKVTLKFTVDATCPFLLTVYYLATEVMNNRNVTIRFDTPKGYPAYDHEQQAQFGYEFVLPPEEALDLNKVNPDLLQADAKANFYPLIILVKPVQEFKCSDAKRQNRVISQSTYVTFNSNSTGLVAKVVHQKICMDNRSYHLQDLYGVGEDSSIQDCVICMSASSNTAIFPCRHLCLCAECAEMLRTQTNKCPICRRHVESLLPLSELIGDKESDEDDSDDMTTGTKTPG